ncbi:MAG: GTPase, partial [Candidatus Woesearchaeota archaeon]
MSEATRQKIKELEEELSKTKYNKRTQHAIGLLKAKIAGLKEKAEHHEKKGPAAYGYSVKKTGDATAVLLGFPSVGKSTLLNKLTNAKSEVAAYEFTTLTVIPGLLEHKGAKIQILDVPGVLEGASTGTGRGKEVIQVIRNSDLLLILTDATRPRQLDVLYNELQSANIRLNEKIPDVKITKTIRGGVRVGKTVRLTKLTDETIKAICNELRITNAEVLVRQDITADQMIDVIRGNRKYLPSIVIANKIDKLSEDKHKDLQADIKISALQGKGIDELKELMFSKLEITRIYCKQIGKAADTETPLIMKSNPTVEDMCRKLHKDFVA